MDNGQFKKGMIPWNKGKGYPIGTINKVKCEDGIRNQIKVRTGTNHNYMKYARWLMEQKLERNLKPEELVHHINGDKLDDRIENLELTTFRNHMSHHMKGRLPVAGMEASLVKRKEERNKHVDAVRNLCREKENIGSISNHLNLGWSMVRRIIQENKIDYNPLRGIPFIKKREKYKPLILRLRSKGLTYIEISKEVPFSRITIGKIIRGEKNAG